MSKVIAKEMPRPEDFNPAVIRNHYGDISDEELELYSEIWLDERLIALIRRILDWIVAGYTREEGEVFTGLATIISRNWRYVDLVVANALIVSLKRMDPSGAIPLLQEIASAPDANSELRELAEGLVRISAREEDS